MDFKIIKEVKRTEYNRKCGILTCVHYAGGFCVGCESDECDFAENMLVEG